MKKLAAVIVLVLTLVVFNYAYAQGSTYEMKGTGAAIFEKSKPELYISNLGLTLSGQASVVKGIITIRGHDISTTARIIPEKWIFSYNTDGSLHGNGPVKTSQNEIYNVVLDGNRIFATNTSSMWKLSATMEENDKRYTLEYLVLGKDPQAKVNVASTAQVIIPNGNSATANTGFFVPLNLEAMPGTVVTWQNEDNIAHSIQSIDKDGTIIPIFNSGLLKAGDTFSHPFNSPGIYHYYCSIHPWRIGVITIS